MGSIKLGDKARDTITGFSGTVTARAEYLNGTPRLMLSALVEGKPVDWWFDEDRMESQLDG